MTAPYRRTVAKVYEFPPEEREAHTFSSAAVRLDGATCTLRLKATDGKYPTTGENYVTTPLHSPAAVRQWRSLDAVVATPTNAKGEAVTAVTYRVGNGTSLYYWNGAAWAVAGAGQWNTLAQVQTNLPTFPVTARELQLAIRLATTDPKLTPTVQRVVVAFDADVPSFAEELVHRTLVRELAKVRFVAELVVAWPATGTTYVLDLAALEEPPGEVVDVVGAFNRDTDADLATDLLASYNTGTHTVTLTGSVTAGVHVELRLLCKPDVALATHPDYDELANLPAVLLESVDERFAGQGQGHEGAVDRTTLAALELAPPRCATYDVGLRVVAARSLDLLRLGEAVEALFLASPLIASPALDARVSVVQLAPLSTSPKPSAAHVHDGTLTVRVSGVEKWTQKAKGSADGMYGVGELNVTVAGA